MPTPPPTTEASIRVVKQFEYRGAIREFSNRYYFDNDAPTDSTKWTTLSDAVVTAEKAIYPSRTNWKIIETVGYEAGSEIPVFTKAYSTLGTGSFANSYYAPGDCAAMVRWSTASRSTKNHPIYLFNYWHMAQYEGATGEDTLNAAQRTAMGTYAAAWITGFSDGTLSHHRTSPYSHAASGYLIDPYVRHRDFVGG